MPRNGPPAATGKAAASTALPQPPNVSQNVPKNSAASRFVIGTTFLPLRDRFGR
jgi:hypothetical protein